MKTLPAIAGLRVLYLGRLSPEKGVDVLLRAWALLQNSPSAKSAEAQGTAIGGTSAGASEDTSSLSPLPSSLTIVGDGPERSALEAIAPELGISDQVEFTGGLPRADALARLSSASLLVFPSIWYETFGLVILEAAGQGIPAIVTSIGGQASLVQDGMTGRHVPPGDPVALATALRELLSNPAGLRRMGEAARAAFEASDCIPVRNLAQLERVYASCSTLHNA